MITSYIDACRAADAMGHETNSVVHVDAVMQYDPRHRGAIPHSIVGYRLFKLEGNHDTRGRSPLSVYIVLPNLYTTQKGTV